MARHVADMDDKHLFVISAGKMFDKCHLAILDD